MLSFSGLTMFDEVRISLQGTNNIMYFELSAPVPDFLHVTALLNSYNKYAFNYSQWFKCQNLNKQCLYMSANHQVMRSKKYAIVGDLSIHSNLESLRRQRKNKISWNEASEICSNLGGYLPHFTSRDEMDEFIALLLKSDKLPFIEAIHIGLTHRAEQVSLKTFSSFYT